MTPPNEQDRTEGIERRRFLQSAAVLTWATPTVLTLMASPAGAQSAPCLAHGMPCDSCEGTVPCCPTAEDQAASMTGGCCCADFNVDCPAGTDGTCTPTDAECAGNNTPGTDFACAVLGPPMMTKSLVSVGGRRRKV